MYVKHRMEIKSAGELGAWGDSQCHGECMKLEGQFEFWSFPSSLFEIGFLLFLTVYSRLAVPGASRESLLSHRPIP